jgi:hypothetical protein
MKPKKNPRHLKLIKPEVDPDLAEARRFFRTEVARKGKLRTPPTRTPRPAPTPSQGRARSQRTETFARIPHGRAFDLYRRIRSGAAWLVLIEIDHRILKEGGKNPVKLSNQVFQRAGMSRDTKWKALRQLETAGVIRIQTLGCGQAPWITHLWFPPQS